MVRFMSVMLFCALCASAAFAYNLQTVVINGQSMVALTTFGDCFGATIGYDCGRNGISIALNSCTVVLIPDSQTAWINGNPVALAAPVVVIDDITYVPLSFLCLAFNLNYNCPNGGQPVIINGCTQQSVLLVFDFSWCGYPHVWCHNFDCRRFQNYRCGPPCGGGFSGYRPGWNGGGGPSCGGGGAGYGPRNAPGGYGGHGGGGRAGGRSRR